MADDTSIRADDGEGEPLDVLDLPQLYQKPSVKLLLSVLEDLTLAPPSWDTTSSTGAARNCSTTPARIAGSERKIKSEGVPSYLTKIIASPLAWIEDDEEKERIWEGAAQRLSERSGRTGMGDITRTFSITTGEDADDALEIVLHEPALQEDNLGLKTWASSYLLAKRLPALRRTSPELQQDAQILELGSGTGLVGLAAAAILRRHVVLTDLPEIVPNLERNLQTNTTAMEARSGTGEAAVLDWSRPANFNVTSTPHSFALILAADPIYSSDHPRLLIQTIARHLAKTKVARVVIELPLREAYAPEREELRQRMEEVGLRLLDQGEEVGYDDWGASSTRGRDAEELAEVRCWWGVWGWG